MAVLADGEMIVGDGTTDPVAESGATLRNSLGMGTGDAVGFTSVALGGGTALANYVEGTWTPVWTSASGSGTVTYSLQIGTYTRIGDRVFCHIELATADISSRTGAITITGLPINSATGGASAGGGVIEYPIGFSITAGETLTVWVEDNTTTLRAYIQDSTDTARSMDAVGDWTDNGRAIATFAYKV
jgi:hypothetical protein